MSGCPGLITQVKRKLGGQYYKLREQREKAAARHEAAVKEFLRSVSGNSNRRNSNRLAAQK